MSWINPKIIGNVESFRKKFSNNSPFPHVLIHNFLKNNEFNKVKASLLKEPMEEKECDLFHFFQSKNLVHAKEKVLKDFVKEISSPEVLGFLSMISGISLSGSVDVSAFTYGPTHYLICHDDRLEGRKVAFVFYASKTKGGELIFFSSKNKQPKKVIKKYSPAPNSLMIFEVSSKSFHEVKEVISGNRHSIGGWFY